MKINDWVYFWGMGRFANPVVWGDFFAKYGILIGKSIDLYIDIVSNHLSPIRANSTTYIVRNVRKRYVINAYVTPINMAKIYLNLFLSISSQPRGLET